MGGVQIDPELLRQVARQIDTAATAVGTELGRLQSTVTTDNPWGGDEPGTVFGMLYTGLLGHAFESMASHQEKLAEGAGRLAAWAAVMQVTEETITSAVEGVF